MRAFSCLYLLKCLIHIFDQLVTAVFVCFWIVCFIICSPVISVVRITCKAWMHHIRTPHMALLRSAGGVQFSADPMQTCSLSPKAKRQSVRCSGSRGEESAPPRLCPMNVQVWEISKKCRNCNHGYLLTGVIPAGDGGQRKSSLLTGAPAAMREGSLCSGWILRGSHRRYKLVDIEYGPPPPATKPPGQV